MFRILILTFVVSFLGCKNDSVPVIPEISELEKNYIADPTEDNFLMVITKLSELIRDTDNKDLRKKYIIKGISFSEDAKNTLYYPVFLKEFIRFFPDDEKTSDYLWKLAGIFNEKSEKEIAAILYQGYKKSFPDDKNVKAIPSDLNSEITDIDSMVKGKAEAIFVNPDETGMNTQNIRHYIDICEAVAIAFPKDSLTAEYLFRAAEMSRSIRSFPKALNLYSWITDRYPTYEKASLALFLQGFIFENEFKQKDKAKIYYTRFVETYPQSPMIGDVKFLLENLDKTEEELMKLIEEKQKNQTK
ncbi:MAG: hypothetical protein IPM42_18745 [Saprospiraceae bacterium]|nr:hypothetical protein [Saprospiraceae bacterium]